MENYQMKEQNIENQKVLTLLDTKHQEEQEKKQNRNRSDEKKKMEMTEAVRDDKDEENMQTHEYGGVCNGTYTRYTGNDMPISRSTTETEHETDHETPMTGKGLVKLGTDKRNFVTSEMSLTDVIQLKNPNFRPKYIIGTLLEMKDQMKKIPNEEQRISFEMFHIENVKKQPFSEWLTDYMERVDAKFDGKYTLLHPRVLIELHGLLDGNLTKVMFEETIFRRLLLTTTRQIYLEQDDHPSWENYRLFMARQNAPIAKELYEICMQQVKALNLYTMNPSSENKKLQQEVQLTDPNAKDNALWTHLEDLIQDLTETFQDTKKVEISLLKIRLPTGSFLSRIGLLKQFMEIKQGADESVMQYALRLQELAQRCFHSESVNFEEAFQTKWKDSLTEMTPMKESCIARTSIMEKILKIEAKQHLNNPGPATKVVFQNGLSIDRFNENTHYWPDWLERYDTLADQMRWDTKQQTNGLIRLLTGSETRQKLHTAAEKVDRRVRGEVGRADNTEILHRFKTELNRLFVELAPKQDSPKDMFLTTKPFADEEAIQYTDRLTKLYFQANPIVETGFAQVAIQNQLFETMTAEMKQLDISSQLREEIYLTLEKLSLEDKEENKKHLRDSWDGFKEDQWTRESPEPEDVGEDDLPMKKIVSPSEVTDVVLTLSESCDFKSDEKELESSNLEQTEQLFGSCFKQLFQKNNQLPITTQSMIEDQYVETPGNKKMPEAQPDEITQLERISNQLSTISQHLSETLKSNQLTPRNEDTIMKSEEMTENSNGVESDHLKQTRDSYNGLDSSTQERTETVPLVQRIPSFRKVQLEAREAQKSTNVKENWDSQRFFQEFQEDRVQKEMDLTDKDSLSDPLERKSDTSSMTIYQDTESPQQLDEQELYAQIQNELSQNVKEQLVLWNKGQKKRSTIDLEQTEMMESAPTFPQQRRKISRSVRTDVTCYRCNLQGHIAKNCPSENKREKRPEDNDLPQRNIVDINEARKSLRKALRNDNRNMNPNRRMKSRKLKVLTSDALRSSTSRRDMNQSRRKRCFYCLRTGHVANYCPTKNRAEELQPDPLQARKNYYLTRRQFIDNSHKRMVTDRERNARLDTVEQTTCIRCHTYGHGRENCPLFIQEQYNKNNARRGRRFPNRTLNRTRSEIESELDEDLTQRKSEETREYEEKERRATCHYCYEKGHSHLNCPTVQRSLANKAEKDAFANAERLKTVRQSAVYRKNIGYRNPRWNRGPEIFPSTYPNYGRNLSIRNIPYRNRTYLAQKAPMDHFDNLNPRDIDPRKQKRFRLKTFPNQQAEIRSDFVPIRPSRNPPILRDPGIPSTSTAHEMTAKTAQRINRKIENEMEEARQSIFQGNEQDHTIYMIDNPLMEISTLLVECKDSGIKDDNYPVVSDKTEQNTDKESSMENTSSLNVIEPQKSELTSDMDDTSESSDDHDISVAKLDLLETGPLAIAKNQLRPRNVQKILEKENILLKETHEKRPIFEPKVIEKLKKSHMKNVNSDELVQPVRKVISDELEVETDLHKEEKSESAVGPNLFKATPLQRKRFDLERLDKIRLACVFPTVREKIDEANDVELADIERRKLRKNWTKLYHAGDFNLYRYVYTPSIINLLYYQRETITMEHPLHRWWMCCNECQNTYCTLCFMECQKCRKRMSENLQFPKMLKRKLRKTETTEESKTVWNNIWLFLCSIYNFLFIPIPSGEEVNPEQKNVDNVTDEIAKMNKSAKKRKDRKRKLESEFNISLTTPELSSAETDYRKSLDTYEQMRRKTVELRESLVNKPTKDENIKIKPLKLQEKELQEKKPQKKNLTETTAAEVKLDRPEDLWLETFRSTVFEPSTQETFGTEKSDTKSELDTEDGSFDITKQRYSAYTIETEFISPRTSKLISIKICKYPSMIADETLKLERLFFEPLLSLLEKGDNEIRSGPIRIENGQAEITVFNSLSKFTSVLHKNTKLGIVTTKLRTVLRFYKGAEHQDVVVLNADELLTILPEPEPVVKFYQEEPKLLTAQEEYAEKLSKQVIVPDDNTQQNAIEKAELCVTEPDYTRQKPLENGFYVVVKKRIGHITVLEIMINDKKALALVDTGAPSSILSSKFMDEQLPNLRVRPPHDSKTYTMDGTTVIFRGSATINIEFRSDDQEVTPLSVIVDISEKPLGRGGYDFVIGTDILQKFGWIRMNFKEKFMETLRTGRISFSAAPIYVSQAPEESETNMEQSSSKVDAMEIDGINTKICGMMTMSSPPLEQTPLHSETIEENKKGTDEVDPLELEGQTELTRLFEQHADMLSWFTKFHEDLRNYTDKVPMLVEELESFMKLHDSKLNGNLPFKSEQLQMYPNIYIANLHMHLFEEEMGRFIPLLKAYESFRFKNGSTITTTKEPLSACELLPSEGKESQPLKAIDQIKQHIHSTIQERDPEAFEQKKPEIDKILRKFLESIDNIADFNLFEPTEMSYEINGERFQTLGTTDSQSSTNQSPEKKVKGKYDGLLKIFVHLPYFEKPYFEKPKSKFERANRILSKEETKPSIPIPVKIQNLLDTYEKEYKDMEYILKLFEGTCVATLGPQYIQSDYSTILMKDALKSLRVIEFLLKLMRTENKHFQSVNFETITPKFGTEKFMDLSKKFHTLIETLIDFIKAGYIILEEKGISWVFADTCVKEPEEPSIPEDAGMSEDKDKAPTSPHSWIIIEPIRQDENNSSKIEWKTRKVTNERVKQKLEESLNETATAKKDLASPKIAERQLTELPPKADIIENPSEGIFGILSENTEKERYLKKYYDLDLRKQYQNWKSEPLASEAQSYANRYDDLVESLKRYQKLVTDWNQKMEPNKPQFHYRFLFDKVTQECYRDFQAISDNIRILDIELKTIAEGNSHYIHHHSSTESSETTKLLDTIIHRISQLIDVNETQFKISRQPTTVKQFEEMVNGEEYYRNKLANIDITKNADGTHHLVSKIEPCDTAWTPLRENIRRDNAQILRNKRIGKEKLSLFHEDKPKCDTKNENGSPSIQEDNKAVLVLTDLDAEVAMKCLLKTEILFTERMEPFLRELSHLQRMSKYIHKEIRPEFDPRKTLIFGWQTTWYLEEQCQMAEFHLMTVKSTVKLVKQKLELMRNLDKSTVDRTKDYSAFLRLPYLLAKIEENCKLTDDICLGIIRKWFEIREVFTDPSGEWYPTRFTREEQSQKSILDPLQIAICQLELKNTDCTIRLENLERENSRKREERRWIEKMDKTPEEKPLWTKTEIALEVNYETMKSLTTVQKVLKEAKTGRDDIQDMMLTTKPSHEIEKLYCTSLPVREKIEFLNRRFEKIESWLLSHEQPTKPDQPSVDKEPFPTPLEPVNSLKIDKKIKTSSPDSVPVKQNRVTFEDLTPTTLDQNTIINTKINERYRKSDHRYPISNQVEHILEDSQDVVSTSRYVIYNGNVFFAPHNRSLEYLKNIIFKLENKPLKNNFNIIVHHPATDCIEIPKIEKVVKTRKGFTAHKNPKPQLPGKMEEDPLNLIDVTLIEDQYNSLSETKLTYWTFIHNPDDETIAQFRHNLWTLLKTVFKDAPHISLKRKTEHQLLDTKFYQTYRMIFNHFIKYYSPDNEYAPGIEMHTCQHRLCVECEHKMAPDSYFPLQRNMVIKNNPFEKKRFVKLTKIPIFHHWNERRTNLSKVTDKQIGRLLYWTKPEEATNLDYENDALIATKVNQEAEKYHNDKNDISRQYCVMHRKVYQLDRPIAILGKYQKYTDTSPFLQYVLRFRHPVAQEEECQKHQNCKIVRLCKRTEWIFLRAPFSNSIITFAENLEEVLKLILLSENPGLISSIELYNYMFNTLVQAYNQVTLEQIRAKTDRFHVIDIEIPHHKAPPRISTKLPDEVLETLRASMNHTKAVFIKNFQNDPDGQWILNSRPTQILVLDGRMTMDHHIGRLVKKENEEISFVLQTHDRKDHSVTQFIIFQSVIKTQMEHVMESLQLILNIVCPQVRNEKGALQNSHQAQHYLKHLREYIELINDGSSNDIWSHCGFYLRTDNNQPKIVDCFERQTILLDFGCDQLLDVIASKEFQINLFSQMIQTLPSTWKQQWFPMRCRMIRDNYAPDVRSIQHDPGQDDCITSEEEDETTSNLSSDEGNAYNKGFETSIKYLVQDNKIFRINDAEIRNPRVTISNAKNPIMSILMVDFAQRSDNSSSVPFEACPRTVRIQTEWFIFKTDKATKDDIIEVREQFVRDLKLALTHIYPDDPNQADIETNTILRSQTDGKVKPYYLNSPANPPERMINRKKVEIRDKRALANLKLSPEYEIPAAMLWRHFYSALATIPADSGIQTMPMIPMRPIHAKNHRYGSPTNNTMFALKTTKYMLLPRELCGLPRTMIYRDHIFVMINGKVFRICQELLLSMTNHPTIPIFDQVSFILFVTHQRRSSDKWIERNVSEYPKQSMWIFPRTEKDQRTLTNFGSCIRYLYPDNEAEQKCLTEDLFHFWIAKRNKLQNSGEFSIKVLPSTSVMSQQEVPERMNVREFSHYLAPELFMLTEEEQAEEDRQDSSYTPMDNVHEISEKFIAMMDHGPSRNQNTLNVNLSKTHVQHIQNQLSKIDSNKTESSEAIETWLHNTESDEYQDDFQQLQKSKHRKKRHLPYTRCTFCKTSSHSEKDCRKAKRALQDKGRKRVEYTKRPDMIVTAPVIKEKAANPYAPTPRDYSRKRNGSRHKTDSKYSRLQFITEDKVSSPENEECVSQEDSTSETTSNSEPANGSCELERETLTIQQILNYYFQNAKCIGDWIIDTPMILTYKSPPRSKTLFQQEILTEKKAIQKLKKVLNKFEINAAKRYGTPRGFWPKFASSKPHVTDTNIAWVVNIDFEDLSQIQIKRKHSLKAELIPMLMTADGIEEQMDRPGKLSLYAYHPTTRSINRLKTTHQVHNTLLLQQRLSQQKQSEDKLLRSIPTFLRVYNVMNSVTPDFALPYLKTQVFYKLFGKWLKKEFLNEKERLLNEKMSLKLEYTQPTMLIIDQNRFTTLADDGTLCYIEKYLEELMDSRYDLLTEALLLFEDAKEKRIIYSHDNGKNKGETSLKDELMIQEVVTDKYRIVKLTNPREFPVVTFPPFKKGIQTHTKAGNPLFEQGYRRLSQAHYREKSRLDSDSLTEIFIITSNREGVAQPRKIMSDFGLVPSTVTKSPLTIPRTDKGPVEKLRENTVEAPLKRQERYPNMSRWETDNVQRIQEEKLAIENGQTIEQYCTVDPKYFDIMREVMTKDIELQYREEPRFPDCMRASDVHQKRVRLEGPNLLTSTEMKESASATEKRRDRWTKIKNPQKKGEKLMMRESFCQTSGRGIIHPDNHRPFLEGSSDHSQTDAYYDYLSVIKEFETAKNVIKRLQGTWNSPTNSIIMLWQEDQIIGNDHGIIMTESEFEKIAQFKRVIGQHRMPNGLFTTVKLFEFKTNSTINDATTEMPAEDRRFAFIFGMNPHQVPTHLFESRPDTPTVSCGTEEELITFYYAPDFTANQLDMFNVGRILATSVCILRAEEALPQGGKPTEINYKIHYHTENEHEVIEGSEFNIFDYRWIDGGLKPVIMTSRFFPFELHENKDWAKFQDMYSAASITIDNFDTMGYEINQQREKEYRRVEALYRDEWNGPRSDPKGLMKDYFPFKEFPFEETNEIPEECVADWTKCRITVLDLRPKQDRFRCVVNLKEGQDLETSDIKATESWLEKKMTAFQDPKTQRSCIATIIHEIMSKRNGKVTDVRTPFHLCSKRDIELAYLHLKLHQKCEENAEETVCNRDEPERKALN